MKSFPSLAQPLIFVFLILSIISGGAAYYFSKPVLLLLPIIGALGLYTVYDYKIFFFILIGSLPISKEFPVIGDSNLSIPAEGLILFLSGIYIITSLFLKKNNWSIFKDPTIIILLLLLFWAFFEFPFTIDKVKTAKYLIAKILYYIVFIFMAFDIIESKGDLKKIILSYSLGLLIGVSYTVIAHGLDSFSFDGINIISRVFFVNHVYYSTLVGIGIPLLWFLLKVTPKVTFKSLYISTSIILLLFALITAYTRSSWIALIICAIFYQLLKYQKVSIIILTSVISIVSLTVYLFTEDRYLNYASDYSSTIFHKGDLKGHLEATYTMKDVSGMERVYRWVAGANMVKEKPIMGSGPGTFYPEYKKYALDKFRTYVSDNPEQSTTHNNFLLFLTEQGIVGFLLFSTLVVMVFIRGSKIYIATKDKETQYLTAGFYLAFVSIIVCMMFSDFTETDKVGTFFLLSITILAKINSWNQQEKEFTA